MRQIVLYISLLLGTIGCRGSEEAVVESRSIASLWSYIGRETVLITEDISLRGYVVANDKYGELRRAIVVEDGSAGVMVELDMEDVELSIPLYSRVEVNCSVVINVPQSSRSPLESLEASRQRIPATSPLSMALRTFCNSLRSAMRSPLTISR